MYVCMCGVYMCVYVCMYVWLCLYVCMVMPVRPKPWLYTCKHVWLCVVMCGYVCSHGHGYVHVVMYVCVGMYVGYTSPRRNHSIHEYKYFVKPLPSAA